MSDSSSSIDYLCKDKKAAACTDHVADQFNSVATKAQ